MLHTVKRALDAQTADGRAGILDHVPGAAGCADLRDDCQNDILGMHAGRQSAVDRDTHIPRLGLPQRLGCQHVGDLGGADAEGERAHRPMRRRVAVAAHDDHSGLAEALLGPDDMHDALPAIVEAEQSDAGRACVNLQVLDHRPAVRLVDRGEASARRCHVVVGCRERAIGAAHGQVSLRKHAKGVARPVMHEVAVDVQQRCAIRARLDRMRGPDLVEQRRRVRASPAPLFGGLGSRCSRRVGAKTLAHRVPFVGADAAKSFAHRHRGVQARMPPLRFQFLSTADRRRR